MELRLVWDDPATGERRQPLLALPIALGRDFQQMPSTQAGNKVSRLTFNSAEISRFHCLLSWENGHVSLTDQNSSNGVFVNGQKQSRCTLQDGDILQLGPYQITVQFAFLAAPTVSSQILFHPDTDLPDPQASLVAPPPSSQKTEFPPPLFQQLQVSVPDLHATGLGVDEVDYAAVGAGLGSFVWVDLLRISGVPPQQIVAIGMEEKPYGRYKRLCLNSQIPLHERLRSNSDSCPDNIWGFPSYAFREAWRDLYRGNVSQALSYLWQVFAEPTFAQTYTPKAGNVFDSIDREAKRINWLQIFRYGSVRSIRQTDDGRYVLAYSRTTATQREHRFLIARNVHLAIGYPAIQFLPDLQDYRQKNLDFKSVVNAYENHDHIYEYLEKYGGTVLIRGRGIVASRIVQRLYEARFKNSQISLLHLMRTPKPKGNHFGSSQRRVENHYEFQPFNWPKACWGGELREMLEKASPEERFRLLKAWGGTTTAQRQDWQKIVEDGLREGWYKIAFGKVEKVEKNAQNKPITYIQEQGLNSTLRLEADFVIDATGLDAKIEASPLLKDLVTHYNLPLLENGRLSVSNHFELTELRQSKGAIYASGASTLGGPYAAVDSFLGLQYAALCSVDHLTTIYGSKLQKLTAIPSFMQWLKWVLNRQP